MSQNMENIILPLNVLIFTRMSQNVIKFKFSVSFVFYLLAQELKILMINMAEKCPEAILIDSGKTGKMGSFSKISGS